MARSRKQPPKKQRKKPDWEAIERDYFAGIRSIGEIAREHHISRTAIQKRATKHEWKRNLAAAVRAETERRLVAPSVAGSNAREIIDENAATQVGVVHTHRRDIGRVRGLFMRLVERVEGVLDGKDAALGVEVLDKEGKAVGHEVRIPVLGERESLSEFLLRASHALAKLVPLERQAFGLEPRNRQETGADDDAGKPSAASAASDAAIEAIGERWFAKIQQGPGAAKANGDARANGYANGDGR